MGWLGIILHYWCYWGLWAGGMDNGTGNANGNGLMRRFGVLRGGHGFILHLIWVRGMALAMDISLDENREALSTRKICVWYLYKAFISKASRCTAGICG